MKDFFSKLQKSKTAKATFLDYFLSLFLSEIYYLQGT